VPQETFKSVEAYRKWNAYRHMHDIPAPNLKRVKIKGKVHKVKHSALSDRKMSGKLSEMG
jgi:hypothetical protein